MKRIALLATCLALVVVLLGAYTRLKDAGLGCPDWPGCYGHWTVPTHPEHLAKVNAHYPDQPLVTDKAWAEMVHRYFAATLGLLVAGLAVHAWRFKRHYTSSQRKLIYGLLCLVILQGLLGKYTVTFGLHPGIVMAHLLGGFTTLTVLSLLFYMKSTHRSNTHAGKRLPAGGILCTTVLLIQIALGGWTSANYAARSCPTLPSCTDDWLKIADFDSAFSMPAIAGYAHGAGTSHEYAPHLDVASKITIQMTHRIGAALTLIFLGSYFLGILLSRKNPGRIRTLALVGLTTLSLQISLGILNIVLDLPLAIAVAHNGVAVLLLISLVLLNYALYQQSGIRHEPSRRSSADYEHTSMA